MSQRKWIIYLTGVSAYQLMSGNYVNVTPPSGEGDPGGVVDPTLAAVAGIIATNIPSLAEVATTIGGSAPAPTHLAPTAPPSIDNMAYSIAPHIPSLTGTANTLANSSPAMLNSTPSNSPVPDAASLDSIVCSLASLAGIISSVATPAVSTAPSAPQHPPSLLQPPSPPRIRVPGDTGTWINY